MGPHIPSVMGLCLKYITYDPNYNYDNEEEEEEEEMMETGNGEDEEQGACACVCIHAHTFPPLPFPRPNLEFITASFLIFMLVIDKVEFVRTDKLARQDAEYPWICLCFWVGDVYLLQLLYIKLKPSNFDMI